MSSAAAVSAQTAHRRVKNADQPILITDPVAEPTSDLNAPINATVQKVDGVWHIEPADLQVPIGFAGDIVWSIEEAQPDVTFCDVNPIMFVPASVTAAATTGKKFPGSSPVTGSRQIIVPWQNDAPEFKQQRFTYYVFLNDCAISENYPIRVDPTVENLPPS